jgi:SdrD B-like domain
MYRGFVVKWCSIVNLGFVLFSLFIFFSFNIPVFGSSFTTNTLLDTIDINPGDGICADSSGNCSLRAGIMETNVLPGTDTFNIVAGNYQLTQLDQDSSNNLSYFLITDSLNIIGSGSGTTSISTLADGLNSVFSFSGISVSISGLSVVGSSDLCSNGLSIYSSNQTTLNDLRISNCNRGLFVNQSNITINNSTFINNSIQGVYSFESNIELNNVDVSENLDGGIIIFNSDNTKIARINNSRIYNNAAVKGGGVFFQESCFTSTIVNSLYIKNSEISNNTATVGGGIYNLCGHLDLENTTIAENTASSSGGGLHTTYPFNSDANFDNGGSVIIAYQAISTTFTEIRNSTFSGNTSPQSGAIFVDTNRPVAATVPYTFDMINTTIANNSSGIGFYESSNNEAARSPIDIRLRNNLLVNNGNKNCEFTDTGTGYNVEQDIILESTYMGNNNLSDDVSCGQLSSFTQNNTLNNFLGPLQDNGNNVRTHALLTGSAAINSGSNTDCPATDQILTPRPTGANCDIGALEYVVTTRQVSGVLYIDLNNNGIQDTGDVTLKNVRVEILNTNGDVIKTVTTDENGSFTVELEDGDYTYQLDLNSIELSEELRSSILAFGSINQRFTIGGQGTITIQIPLVTNDNVTQTKIPGLIRTGGN